MSDLSSVDVDLDAARVAFDFGIDGVQSAVQSALHGIDQQIELLEGVRESLEIKREAVELEIDGLSDRAAQLQALSLPASVSAPSGLAHAAVAEIVYEDNVVEYSDDEVYVDEDGNEVIEVIEYVDEDGNPVDEQGNPLDEQGNPVDYADEVVEVSLDDAGWADLELPRTDRLVALVEFHGEITTAEAVEALAEVGDEVSTSTVSASLGNLARQGRITKLDAGLFGPA
jgi:hypothetical protein